MAGRLVFTRRWSTPYKLKSGTPRRCGVAGRPFKVLPSALKDHLKISIYQSKMLNTSDALMDRGANGGVAGDGMRPVGWTDRFVDINGVDDHTIRQLRIGTFGAVTRSQKGNIIIVVPQLAYMPDGKTIISCCQVENYKVEVNEKSPHITGKIPCVKTLEGCGIPIAIKNGLPHMQLRPFTDEEWKTLPRVQITSEKDWDPKILDAPIPETWYEEQPMELEETRDNILDRDGKYHGEDDLPDGPDDMPEEGDIELDEQSSVHSVSREDIKVYLHNMIRDECDEEFMYYQADNNIYEHRLNDYDRVQVFDARTRPRRSPTVNKYLQPKKKDSDKKGTPCGPWTVSVATGSFLLGTLSAGLGDLILCFMYNPGYAPRRPYCVVA